MKIGLGNPNKLHFHVTSYTNLLSNALVLHIECKSMQSTPAHIMWSVTHFLLLTYHAQHWVNSASHHRTQVTVPLNSWYFLILENIFWLNSCYFLIKLSAIQGDSYFSPRFTCYLLIFFLTMTFAAALTNISWGYLSSMKNPRWSSTWFRACSRDGNGDILSLKNMKKTCNERSCQDYIKQLNNNHHVTQSAALASVRAWAAGVCKHVWSILPNSSIRHPHLT